MIDQLEFSILTLRLRNDRHVVQARQRARDIAGLLGFDHQEQTRLATATSELARNAFRYATGGKVEFLVRSAHSNGLPGSGPSPVVSSWPGSGAQLFVICVTDSGPGIANLAEILGGRYKSKTGLGNGILGTKRLMDHFSITSSPAGTRAEAGKSIPGTAAAIGADELKGLVGKLASIGARDPFDEIEQQNQDLVTTLTELREQQEILAALNLELADTNRGVVALYAELEQRATDLRRVSDFKTSFISNLSHEFRTPLNSIASLSRLLLHHTDGHLTSEQEKQVNYIERSAAELSELVNDLLDLAKVEAGKIAIKPRQFEVQDLFGALRGMLRPLLATRSLDLIFEVEPDLVPLYTDETKVSQILRNLISNALKFTSGGHIRVTAARGADDFIVFRVSDTGIGIAPEDQQRVFEEFVQVEGQLQSEVKGTGLGLPLSRKLAQLLGGTLEVESRPGAGSTFTARIPMCFGQREEEPLADGRSSDAPSSDAQGATILFIEDNRETVYVLQSSLKNSDYRLIFARSLADARATLKQEAPALIVLDRLLGEVDSLFFIEEVRREGFAGPVLAVSVVNEAEAAMQAGATAFLPKPIAHFTLLNMIRELIDGETSKTILLSDDDEVTRYLLGEALARRGFRILEARNGREAVRLAEANLPAAMFLDIVMPGMNGFEVLREIRSHPLMAKLPIIIHSSKLLSASELEFASQLGAVFYPKEVLGTEESSARLYRILSAAGLLH